MARSVRNTFLIYIAGLIVIATLGVISISSIANKEDAFMLISRKEARDDLNNYFNNLDTDTHSHAWGDMDSNSKSYIENKRKAIHSGHGAFTTVDSQGRAQEMKKVWTSAAAAADMDSFYGGSPKKSAAASALPTGSADPPTETDNANKVAKLKAAIQANPALQKQLDGVHSAWFHSHRSPPSSAAERREYAAMVRAAVGAAANPTVAAAAGSPSPARPAPSYSPQDLARMQREAQAEYREVEERRKADGAADLARAKALQNAAAAAYRAKRAAAAAAAAGPSDGDWAAVDGGLLAAAGTGPGPSTAA